jgi:hypothetical protein
MCYNKESSITSYIVSSILSLFLFFNGDKYDKTIAIFCLTFVQMQLVEYFMWIDQDCGKINHYATILGQIVLILQPLSIVICGLIYNTFSLPKLYLYILLIISLIPLIAVIIMNIKNNKQLCSKEQGSGHLEWNFVNVNTAIWKIYHSIQYFSIMLFSWLFFKNQKKGILMFTLMLTSLLYSGFKFKEWESMWCFVATITPLVFLLLQYF